MILYSPVTDKASIKTKPNSKSSPKKKSGTCKKSTSWFFLSKSYILTSLSSPAKEKNTIENPTTTLKQKKYHSVFP
jgi:hypothetical protein